jgi:hypothetical protein
MFGGIRAYSGCIRSRGPYCGMSYECVEVDSELVLRQDPINGYGKEGESASPCISHDRRIHHSQHL